MLVSFGFYLATYLKYLTRDEFRGRFLDVCNGSSCLKKGGGGGENQYGLVDLILCTDTGRAKRKIKRAEKESVDVF